MKRFSLKHIINSVLVLIVFIALVVNTATVFYTWKNMHDIREQNVKTVSYQLGNYLTAENERLGRIQRNLMSQTIGNGFFSLMESENTESVRKKISEYVYSMQEVNANPLYALAISNEGDYCIITETLLGEEFAEMKKIAEKGKEPDGEVNQQNFQYEYFMIEKPNHMKLLYICCYTPVYDYDFSRGKQYHAGNLMICTKINIDQLLMEYEDWSNLDVSLQREDCILEVIATSKSKHKSGFKMEPIGIKNTDWIINGVIYGTTLEEKLFELIMIMMFGFLGIVVLLFVFHKIINRIINKPVKAIVDYLDRRAEGNERCKLEIQEGMEFNAIAESINKMIEADHEKTKCIFMQQQRLYEYELQTKEALLNNLQRQINPHFLYNTLECVRALALVKGADDVADIAVDIADIMRYSLDTSETVTLGDEIAAIKHYLSIMNARYPDRFECNIDISEDIMHCSTMKMILQPVLENAFKHGLQMTKGGNCIDIKAEKKNGDIYVCIRDNGKGIGEEELNRLKDKLESSYSENGNKIGILNVHHRLRLFYGEDYGMAIESVVNEYTSVVLKLPGSDV